MGKFLLIVFCLLLPISTMALDYTFPGTTWETKTAAEVGMDAGAVNTAATQLGGSGAIMRYGYVIKTWGNGLGAKTDWASSGKPVFSFLVWKAIKDGKVPSFETLVKDIYTTETFNEKDSKITLYHLAHMTSGWSRGEQPGDAYSYNDYAINLYGKTVFHHIFKTSGSTPTAIFQSELSMLNFEHNPTLDASKVGRFTNVSVGDIGRMAHLFLNNGNWNGTQLIGKGDMAHMLSQVVPASMPLSTLDGTPSFDSGTLGGGDAQNAANQGGLGPGSYSYNFWINKGKRLWSSLDTNVFQGNGHFGRENYTVFPKEQLIVIHYGNTFTNSQMNTRYSSLVNGITSNPVEPLNPITADTSTDTSTTTPPDTTSGTDPVYLNIIVSNDVAAGYGPWFSSMENGDNDVTHRPTLTINYTNNGTQGTKTYSRPIGGDNPLMYFIADDQSEGNFYDKPDGSKYQSHKYGDAMLIKNGMNRIGFFKCNISDLPPNSTITGASLKMWVDTHEGKSDAIVINISRCLVDWKKTSITKSISNYRGTGITDIPIEITSQQKGSFWTWNWNANLVSYIQEMADEIVSIQSQKEKNIPTIDVHSNPFSSGLSISLPDFQGMGKLTIFDAQGTKLLEERVNSSEVFNWNATNRPAGVYFAELRFEGKQIQNKLMLIK
ncbi:MAG: hypothetical protein HQK83_06805 [Fibrobacteria bacterium]|nr:hypothetical protein [Fibrobacteria bacterium]